ncbi:MAG: hypothetical protein QW570_08870 [Candidatus Caldarchaeum sp.]
MKEYLLTVEFVEPLLGSIPLNSKEHAKFVEFSIQNNGELDQEDFEEEVDSLPEDSDKGLLGFYRDENGLFLFDYHVKGYLKEAANVVKDSEKVTGARSKVDNFVFVEPRRIYLGKKEPDGIITRPLRAITPKGPRTRLVSSEYVSAGTQIECRIVVINTNKVPEAFLRSCLDYGRYKGMGAWRNASFGRFTYSLVDAEARKGTSLSRSAPRR